jgi:hypothetical protein
VVYIVTVLLHTDVSNDTDMTALPVQSDSNYPRVFVIPKDLSVRFHSLDFGASVTDMWHPSGS